LNQWRLHWLALEDELELIGGQLLGTPAEPRPAKLRDQVLEPSHPLRHVGPVALGAQASRALRLDGGGLRRDLCRHGVAQLGRELVEKRGVESGRQYA
jgi:hypothetical protein